MAKPRIGIALCGSYCTYDKLFSQLVLLSDKYELVPIMSETASATDTRFGKAADFLSRLESLCGAKPVCSIAEAEPLGPAKPMEALIIAPCTGNTMAKLNHGITDTAVTMAAKAHLQKLKAAHHSIFHKRRALRLGSQHCRTFKPQKRLHCTLPSG